MSITGLVQGIGFRPFVFRLAEVIGLKGYVLNNTTGILIEVEGGKESLDEFLFRVGREKPELAKIYSLQYSFLEDTGFKDFEIRKSDEQGEKKSFFMPDIAVCG